MIHFLHSFSLDSNFVSFLLKLLSCHYSRKYLRRWKGKEVDRSDKCKWTHGICAWYHNARCMRSLKEKATFLQSATWKALDAACNRKYSAISRHVQHVCCRRDREATHSVSARSAATRQVAQRPLLSARRTSSDLQKLLPVSWEPHLQVALQVSLLSKCILFESSKSWSNKFKHKW